MRSRFRFLLVAVLGILVWQARSAAQQQDVRAVLQPGKRYEILIKKSIGGNDGFKDVIPTTSTQTVLIETGPATSGSLPVTMTIYRNQRTDKRGGLTVGHLVEWKLLFSIAGNGSIENVTAAEGETGLAAPLLRSLMMKQLSSLLFVTPYALEVKNAPIVSIVSSAPRKGSPLVDVTYSASKPDAETSANSQPITETIGGEAVFNPAVKFFVERTQRQASTIYIADNDYESAKTVKMTENTTWSVTVTDR